MEAHGRARLLFPLAVKSSAPLLPRSLGENPTRIKDVARSLTLSGNRPQASPWREVGHLGPYRLDGILGKGGMGVVYAGYDQRLERSVALKRARRSGIERAEARRRLRLEARSLAQLDHPAIVRIYDIVEDGHEDWIVMERVDGQTLTELVGSDGLYPKRGVELGRQIAEGLAAVHAYGLVHRDLKLGNVMVTNPGGRSTERVKILDFGLAEIRSVISSKSPAGVSAALGSPGGALQGTIRAVSPEQILGCAADVRSELFAFGVLLYEMLTGRSPFLGRNIEETANRICTLQQAPISALRPDVPPVLSDLVDELLAKEPELRPQAAGEVVWRLERISVELGESSRATVHADGRPSQEVPSFEALPHGGPTLEASTLEASPWRLREPPRLALPPQPYPVLLPYTHPALMAGREQELEQTRLALRLPVPIFGLGSPSGTGKSSFVLGGLVPALREDGHPVAVVRHAQEPGIIVRLLEELLDGPPFRCTDGEAPASDSDWRGLVRYLGIVERLAGEPPLLVLDQFETVLGDHPSGAARARLGLLLAATAQRRPGSNTPLCRWLLVYRQDFFGELLAWLGDVLVESGQEYGADAVPLLPHDLSGPDRFLALSLSPIATPSPGGDRLAEATAIFRAIIEKPLRIPSAPSIPSGGAGASSPHYGLRFADGHVDRLARIFAESRIARPEAELVPELQVVLAHLVARTDGEGCIQVPDDAGTAVDEALGDHLGRALSAAFPVAVGDLAVIAARRARALLALRELASETGRLDPGLPAASLARAMGADGASILEQLATPLTRLIVLRDSAAGPHYMLSHDRMAEVIVRRVEEEGQKGGLIIDGELLALRRFVVLQTALHGSQGPQKVPPRIPRHHYQRIAAHAGALLWDQPRLAWWAACRRQRRADLVRSALLVTAAMVILALLGWGTWNWIGERRQYRALLEQVVQGEPEEAVRALNRLVEHELAVGGEALALLRRRPHPTDVFEQGLGGVEETERTTIALRIVELALPWVRESPDDPVLIASLAWALDLSLRLADPDSEEAAEARALRERVLEPLRLSRPPPRIPRHDPDWVAVPAGTFLMGNAPGQGVPKDGPQHEVAVSGFRLLRREVTHADYRRLVPTHEGEDDLPVADLTWYQAYTYAAWLGGRLPTEAEWEYAARAGCPFPYCDQAGRRATVDDVARTLRNSVDAQTGDVRPSPVMRFEPNPWGLYDVFGNVWEWTADWHAAYSTVRQTDPWGPSQGMRRVLRGGGFSGSAAWATASFRLAFPPELRLGNPGFRVVLVAAEPHSLER